MPPDDDAAAPALDAAAVLALLASAESKAEAAAAVLMDRRCTPVDAVPLLHLGWSRLLAARAAMDGTEAPSPGAYAADAGAVVPGCRATRRDLALRTLKHVADAHALFGLADPALPCPARDLLWLAHQLRTSVAAVRRDLHLRVDLPRPRRAAPVLAALGSLVVAGGLWFALSSGAVLGARPGWHAVYYRGEALSGPTVERTETELSFDWGHGPPLDGFPVDKWSVRYEGCLPLDEGGEALFRLSSDDGSRVYVDGQLVVDNWGLHGLVSKEGKVTLEPGMHRLRVEYMEGAGGSVFMARMGWNGASPVNLGAPRILLPTGTAEDGPVCGKAP